MKFRWNRLLEAGAIVVIIAITLAQAQTRRSLFNFIAQSFPGDVQYFITITANTPSALLTPCLNQFSISVSRETAATLAIVQTQFPITIP